MAILPTLECDFLGKSFLYGQVYTNLHIIFIDMFKGCLFQIEIKSMNTGEIKINLNIPNFHARNYSFLAIECQKEIKND